MNYSLSSSKCLHIGPTLGICCTVNCNVKCVRKSHLTKVILMTEHKSEILVVLTKLTRLQDRLSNVFHVPHFVLNQKCIPEQKSSQKMFGSCYEIVFWAYSVCLKFLFMERIHQKSMTVTKQSFILSAQVSRHRSMCIERSAECRRSQSAVLMHGLWGPVGVKLVTWDRAG